MEQRDEDGIDRVVSEIEILHVYESPSLLDMLEKVLKLVVPGLQKGDPVVVGKRKSAGFQVIQFRDFRIGSVLLLNTTYTLRCCLHDRQAKQAEEYSRNLFHKSSFIC